MVINHLFFKKVHKKGSIIDDYRVLNYVGEGRYGICYLVEKNSTKYILKEIKPKFFRKNPKKTKLEKEILSSLNHRNIPKMIKCVSNLNTYGYIIEYFQGKTVEDILFDDNHKFSYEDIYNIGLKLILIIEYIHSRNIVHRDIRIPNVILYENNVYLIDFGLARETNNNYTFSEDFLRLGDFLLYLFYSCFNDKVSNNPWYKELPFSLDEMAFFKRLFEINTSYKSILEIKTDFIKIFENKKGYFID